MGVSSKTLLEARVAFSGIDAAFEDPSSLPLLATVDVPASDQSDMLVGLSAVSTLRLLRHTPEYVGPFMECVLALANALVNGIGGADFRVRNLLIMKEGDTEMLLDQLGDGYQPYAAVNLAIPDLVEVLDNPPEREVRLALMQTRFGDRLWARSRFPSGPANPVSMIGAFCATTEALVRRSPAIRPLLPAAAALCLLEQRWRAMGEPDELSSEAMRQLWIATSEIVRAPDPLAASGSMG